MSTPIKVSKGGTIVPEWGNAGREDGDKIVVHYHYLSFAEQQQLLDPNEIGKSLAYESKVIATMIDKIDNLEVDDGKVRKIKDGADLVAEPGLDKLALELWIELKNRTAVDKKK